MMQSIHQLNITVPNWQHCYTKINVHTVYQVCCALHKLIISFFPMKRFACPPVMIFLLSPVHPQLWPLHDTLAGPLWCHAACAFTLSSLCWLFACCLFFVSPFSFFHAECHTEEVLSLHPLPIPVCCSPCTLSPCFHSECCIINLRSHPPHSVTILDCGRFELTHFGSLRGMMTPPSVWSVKKD